jgi:hypothetical protein
MLAALLWAGYEVNEAAHYLHKVANVIVSIK